MLHLLTFLTIIQNKDQNIHEIIMLTNKIIIIKLHAFFFCSAFYCLNRKCFCLKCLKIYDVRILKFHATCLKLQIREFLNLIIIINSCRSPKHLRMSCHKISYNLIFMRQNICDDFLMFEFWWVLWKNLWCFPKVAKICV